MKTTVARHELRSKWSPRKYDSLAAETTTATNTDRRRANRQYQWVRARFVQLMLTRVDSTRAPPFSYGSFRNPSMSLSSRRIKFLPQEHGKGSRKQLCLWSVV